MAGFGHNEKCPYCSRFNRFKAGLVDRFNYGIQNPEDWEMLRDSVYLAQKKEPTRIGSRTHPIKPIKMVLRGVDKYMQSQSYGFIFNVEEIPRDIAHIGDSKVTSSALTVQGIYIDKNGKVDMLRIDKLIRANPYRYPAGKKKWEDFIGRLLDYHKEHWGKVKIIWENPHIEESIAKRLDVARQRIEAVLIGTRFIEPKTGKIITQSGSRRAETTAVFDLLNSPTEYYFDGLYIHSTADEPPATFANVFKGKLLVQMQSCIAYKSPPALIESIHLGNALRGVIPSAPSNIDEFKIINE